MIAWLKNFAPLSQPTRSKTKTNRDLPAAFSRAWRWLHVFASSSDWSVGLYAFVVIGQSDYFGFACTTLNWKLLYALRLQTPMQ